MPAPPIPVPLVALLVGVAAGALPPPARRICRPGPVNPSLTSERLPNVLIIGDSISLRAMADLTKNLAGVATVEHGPFSGDGGALDSKYAMGTTSAMTGAGSGPPWVDPAKLPSGADRVGDGCLNGTFLVSSTQQPYGPHHAPLDPFDPTAQSSLLQSTVHTIMYSRAACGSHLQNFGVCTRLTFAFERAHYYAPTMLTAPLCHCSRYHSSP